MAAPPPRHGPLIRGRRRLAAGRPVVALESTLLAHGLPRPGQPRGRGGWRTRARRRAVPATIAVLDGVAARRAHRRSRSTGSARTRDWPSWASATWRWPPRSGDSGATTVSSTALLAARGRHRGLRHRRARRRAPAGVGDLRRVGRPRPRCRGPRCVVVCAGREVDPGRRRRPWSGWRPLGHGASATGRDVPRLLPGRLGLDGRLAVDDPTRPRRSFARRGAALGRGAVIVANPLPPDEQLDPALHDRVLADAPGCRGRGRGARQGRDAVPAGPLPPGERRRDAWTVNVRLVLRNAGSPAGSPPRWRSWPRMTRVVVVGDVGIDVVVAWPSARTRTDRRRAGDT